MANNRHEAGARKAQVRAVTLKIAILDCIFQHRLTWINNRVILYKYFGCNENYILYDVGASKQDEKLSPE